METIENKRRVDFPKLDVAGSIPVSRSSNQEVNSTRFLQFPLVSVRVRVCALVLRPFAVFCSATRVRGHKSRVTVVKKPSI
jgi:hypothetical protein